MTIQSKPNWDDLLEYRNGKLYWKVGQKNHMLVGSEAGRTDTHGYRQVSIGRRNYFSHRIIWEMHNEPIPEGIEIDHIDGCRSNNLVSNLRLATRNQNQHNRPKRCDNTSGYKGVSWHKKRNKWQVRVMVESKSKHLGYFTDLLEARDAYIEAAKKYHGEFAHADHAKPSNDA